MGNNRAPSKRCSQWKILMATSLTSFWVLGLSQSFGIWQRYYSREAAVNAGMIQPKEMTQRATIAAIGSLGNGGIIAIFGMLYYPYLPLFGRHVKLMCIIATLIMAAGFAGAAGSNHLWILLSTQGLFVGVGGGILFYTLTPILPEYFGKHSGLAQGVVGAAASLGGVFLSFGVSGLLARVGPRKTLGVLAGLTAVIGLVVSVLAQPPRKFEKRSMKTIAWGAFKDPAFALLFLANLLHPLTFANPMIFGPEFSESLKYSDAAGSGLLAGVSAAGFPARLFNGYVADMIGHMNMLLLAAGIYAAGTWGLWLTAARVGDGRLWIAFSLCYGVVNGTFNTVINSIQRRMFGDEMYYPNNGAMTSIRGIGYVMGVPIAGALVKRVQDTELEGSDFINSIVYTGALLTASFVCLAGVRWLEAQKKGWAWKS